MKKNLLPLLLAMVLCLGLAVPSAAANDVDYYVVVTAADGQGVNIREGTGASYPKVKPTPIPMQARLHITREDTAANGGVWGYTSYTENGTTYQGWIAMTEVTREMTGNGALMIDTASLTPEIAEAYLSIINTAISRYGTPEMDGETVCSTGFVGGYLMDLYGDDAPELCIVTFVDYTGEEYNPCGFVPLCEIFSRDGQKFEYAMGWPTYQNLGERLALVKKGAQYYIANRRNSLQYSHETTPGGTFSGYTYYLVDSYMDRNSPEDIDVPFESFADSVYPLVESVDEPFFTDDMGSVFSLKMPLNANELRSTLQSWVERAIHSSDPLALVAYFGDVSKCEMPAEMALAYADALERTASGGGYVGVLLDISGDGYPLLYAKSAAASASHLWQYKGGTASELANDGYWNYVVFDGEPALMDSASYEYREFYRVSKGEAILWHTAQFGELDWYTGWYTLDNDPATRMEYDLFEEWTLRPFNISEEIQLWDGYIAKANNDSDFYGRQVLSYTDASTMVAALRSYADSLAVGEEPPADPELPPEPETEPMPAVVEPSPETEPDITPAEIENSTAKDGENKGNTAVVAAAVGGTAVVGGGGAAWYVLSKKKRLKL